MSGLQILEPTSAAATRATPFEGGAWSEAAGVPQSSRAVAVVLSFGTLDARALRALDDTLRVVPAVAGEVAISCDVGVRTFARALTIRLWMLRGASTTPVIERLAAASAPAHGVALTLSGELAASVEFVDAALAASDHAERALAPGQLALALERARAVLQATARPEALPDAGRGGSSDRDPERHQSPRRGS